MQTAIHPILEHSLIFESGWRSDLVLSCMVFYKQIKKDLKLDVHIGKHMLYVLRHLKRISINIHNC